MSVSKENMSSLVLTLVALYCDVPTRLRMRVVERHAQVSLHECVLQYSKTSIRDQRSLS